MRRKLQQNDEMVAKTAVGTFIVTEVIKIGMFHMLMLLFYSKDRHTPHVYIIIIDSKYDLIQIKVRINYSLHRNAILMTWRK